MKLLPFLFLLTFACGCMDNHDVELAKQVMDLQDKIITMQRIRHEIDSLSFVQTRQLWDAIDEGLYIDSLQTTKLKELYNYINNHQ